MSLNGVDESNNQGDINNAVVPMDFDIIKATEGVGYVDPNCDANYQQAKAAGRKLGVYHFARPDGNDPVSEAKFFVQQTAGYDGKSVFVLDLEVEPITPDWAKQWLDTVYDLTKVRPWLYMSESRFNTGDWSAVWPNYAAWVAKYPDNNVRNGYGAPAAVPNIKGDWVIAGWQYTSHGRLPGWGGNLDLDIFYGDPSAWDKYAVGDRNAPAPAAEPPVSSPEPTPSPSPEPTPVTEPPVQSEPVPTPVTPVPLPDPLPPINLPADPAPQPDSHTKLFAAITAAIAAALLIIVHLLVTIK